MTISKFLIFETCWCTHVQPFPARRNETSTHFRFETTELKRHAQDFEMSIPSSGSEYPMFTFSKMRPNLTSRRQTAGSSLRREPNFQMAGVLRTMEFDLRHPPHGGGWCAKHSLPPPKTTKTLKPQIHMNLWHSPHCGEGGCEALSS